ncbi:MAG: adenosylcobinamide-GDP ribazoletransferase [Caldilineaceae bacterium]|nr:adenosylcobinamide-GDP ribazoletransferase [Caldilineaceae bacterium]
MLHLFTYQIRLFFTALMFFTRIPCPTWVGHSEELLNHSARYFPLVGVLVGAIAAGAFWTAHLLFATPIALLLSMAASIWATGAFHEDGFADFCDGFGGGWTQEQVLTIMKDSRIGTYGAVGIGLLLALKFTTLAALPSAYVPWILIAGHSVSRLASVSLLYTHEYVREDMLSKAKPLAVGMSSTELFIAAISGLTPLLLLWPLNAWGWRILAALLAVFVTRQLLARQFVRRLGGYTGDCLGAVQQVTEVVFYLLLGIAMV